MRGRFVTSALLLLLTLAPTACGERKATHVSPQVYDAAGHLLKDPGQRSKGPNLIVIGLDGLRADALDEETVEGDGPRMPFLASLAERGVHFKNAGAPAPWTLPSTVSLLTGLQPSEHGQYEVRDEWHLPAAITTFPEVLGAGFGYDTAAFLTGAFFERGGASLLQGFDHIERPFGLQDAEGALARWQAKRDAKRPFFLFLQTQELQAPYGEAQHPWPPPPPEDTDLDPRMLNADLDAAELFRTCFLDARAGAALRQRLGTRLDDVLRGYAWRGFAEDPQPSLAADLARAYWEGVTWVDGLLGDTWTLLEREGLLENTVVVIASGHGEALGEHGGLSNGLRLHDELVRIPLIVIAPAPFPQGEVIEADVGLVDVLPTFLELAGMPPLDGISGRSALAIASGETWCRPVVSEERLSRASTGGSIEAVTISARAGRWKYLASLDLETGGVVERIFDLRNDPDEIEDLTGGSGRLPRNLDFDPCLCGAVEAVRDRLWLLPRRTGGRVETTPYGVAAAHIQADRPPPCGEEHE